MPSPTNTILLAALAKAEELLAAGSTIEIGALMSFTAGAGILVDQGREPTDNAIQALTNLIEMFDPSFAPPSAGVAAEPAPVSEPVAPSGEEAGAGEEAAPATVAGSPDEGSAGAAEVAVDAGGEAPPVVVFDTPSAEEPAPEPAPQG